MGRQWHQLDHMQIICTLLQTDNHASTSSLIFYRPGALPIIQSSIKAMTAIFWRCEHSETLCEQCQEIALINIIDIPGHPPYKRSSWSDQSESQETSEVILLSQCHMQAPQDPKNDINTNILVIIPRYMCWLYIFELVHAIAFLHINIIHMMHSCKWNIQICCPEVDMSSRGHSQSDDIWTKGQHIWMFHEQPCFICFVVWPTTRKYKIPWPIYLHLCFTQKLNSKFPLL